MTLKNVPKGINENSRIVESEDRISVYFPYHQDVHISLQEHPKHYFHLDLSSQIATSIPLDEYLEENPKNIEKLQSCEYDLDILSRVPQIGSLVGRFSLDELLLLEFIYPTQIKDNKIKGEYFKISYFGDSPIVNEPTTKSVTKWIRNFVEDEVLLNRPFYQNEELISKMKSFGLYSSVLDVFKEKNNPLYFALRRYEK